VAVAHEHAVEAHDVLEARERQAHVALRHQAGYKAKVASLRLTVETLCIQREWAYSLLNSVPPPRITARTRLRSVLLAVLFSCCLKPKRPRSVRSEWIFVLGRLVSRIVQGQIYLFFKPWMIFATHVWCYLFEL
jgi:hypothetical protein